MSQWIKANDRVPMDPQDHFTRFKDGSKDVYSWDDHRLLFKSDFGRNIYFANKNEVEEWLDEDSPDEPVFSLTDMEYMFDHLMGRMAATTGQRFHKEYFFEIIKSKYNIDL